MERRNNGIARDTARPAKPGCMKNAEQKKYYSAFFMQECGRFHRPRSEPCPAGFYALSLHQQNCIVRRNADGVFPFAQILEDFFRILFRIQ